MDLLVRNARDGGPIALDEVAQLLGRWQRRELLRARTFRECAGLAWQDLEDLYQDTVLALIEREFECQRHLLNALQHGIRQRALRAHEKRHRRERIFAETLPGAEELTYASEVDGPEQRVLAEQDRLIVGEFLTELSSLEQKVFKLLSEGHAWRAASDALGIERDEGRRVSRACERKREQFATLYTAGRLCGFRANTIEALKDGDLESAELARRAYAHLQGCARCRHEHGTDGQRFRSLFDRDAAALVPLPVLVGRLGLLGRFARIHHHLSATQPAAASASVREQLGAIAAGGGVAAKLAAGVATVAVVAGGAVGAHDLLAHRSPGSQRNAPVAEQPLTSARPVDAFAGFAPGSSNSHRLLTGANSRRASSPRSPSSRAAVAASSSRTTDGQRAPSGFAYLGVPRTTSTPAVVARPASPSQTGHGGAFSP